MRPEGKLEFKREFKREFDCRREGRSCLSYCRALEVEGEWGDEHEAEHWAVSRAPSYE
jgi:hypothetical protein